MISLPHKKNAYRLIGRKGEVNYMSGLEKDTIGGFNSLIEKQKQQEGKVRV